MISNFHFAPYEQVKPGRYISTAVAVCTLCNSPPRIIFFALRVMLVASRLLAILRRCLCTYTSARDREGSKGRSERLINDCRIFFFNDSKPATSAIICLSRHRLSGSVRASYAEKFIRRSINIATGGRRGGMASRESYKFRNLQDLRCR